MFLPIQTSLFKEHLKRHYRSLHTHDKPLECTDCGKKFSRSDSLGLHQCTVATCMYDRLPGRYRSGSPRRIRCSSWGSSSTERLHEACTCRRIERFLRFMRLPSVGTCYFHAIKMHNGLTTFDSVQRKLVE